MAIVAGGGRGNGAAIATALGRAGVDVAVVDLRQERADAVAEEIRRDGREAIAIAADIRSDEQVQALVAETASTLGGIDVLVNNAGGMTAFAEWRNLVDWTDHDWDQILDRNLRYVFLTCRAVVPYMTERGGGSIVNVASLSGVTSSPRHAAYGAAKAGLVNLTASLAAECGPSGIRVNAVAPGAILTEANAEILPEAERAALTAAVPLGRIGTPEDVAAAVTFFAGEASAYVTGQTLIVDGGATVTYPLAIAVART